MLVFQRGGAPRLTIGHWVGLLLIACSGGFSQSAAAAEDVAWKTGAALQRQLNAKVGLTWPDSKLRDALSRLSRAQAVSVLLDRNVDPDTIVTIVNDDLPLKDVFERIAQTCDLGVAHVGPVVYISPSPTIQRMSTLVAISREQAAQLPAGVRRQLARKHTCEWEELAEPRNLVASAAGEYGVQVLGIEQIPHDLWPAASLPPLTFIERMTILLAGFDLTFELSSTGTQLRLLPIEPGAVVQRNYNLASASRRSIDQLAERFKEARFTPTAGGVQVAATYADHYEIERLLAGTPPRPKPGGPAGQAPAQGATTHFSLTIENKPAGAVVKTVANNQKLKLEVDPAALARLKSLVSFSVKEVSLDELLQTTLKPLGLGYRIEQGALKVFVKDGGQQ